MSQTRSNVRSPRRDGVAVARAAFLTHGRAEVIGDALDRLRAVAARCGVEVVDEHHPDIVVVLGGDGTMLRALQRWLGTGIPCLGVNFGRVGFLTSIAGTDLEAGLERAFGGGYEVLDLPTLVGDAGGGTIRASTTSCSRAPRRGGWRSSSGGSTASRWASSAATGRSPPARPARPRTTSRPAGPSWSPAPTAYVRHVRVAALPARPLDGARPPAHRELPKQRRRRAGAARSSTATSSPSLEPGERLEVRMGDASAALARVTGTSFFTRYLEAFSH